MQTQNEDRGKQTRWKANKMSLKTKGGLMARRVKQFAFG
jgi:hypothetical protein